MVDIIIESACVGDGAVIVDKYVCVGMEGVVSSKDASYEALECGSLADGRGESQIPEDNEEELLLGIGRVVHESKILIH